MHPFVHLHVHTQYSLLNGALRIKDLFKRAKDMGMTSVAMTDDGNMFGAVDFYKAAKKAGIKPILGVTMPVTMGRRQDPPEDVSNLVLLARTDEGYANLREMISMAWMDGLHHGKPYADFELLQQYNAGVTALSGDANNIIARAVAEGRMDDAERLLKSHQDIFEPDEFYLEVIPCPTDSQQKTNAGYRQLNQTLNVPMIAGNRCLYMDRTDARAHEVLLCIGAGRMLDDPGRPRLDVDSFWFKPGEVMAEQLGPEYSEAIENTERLADRCNVTLSLGEVYLPTYQVPEAHTITSYLAHVTQVGLEERYAEFDAVGKVVDKDIYAARLEEELGIIEGMGFPGYFLIVMDFIQWAKDHDIPVGPGRGSGAGFIGRICP